MKVKIDDIEFSSDKSRIVVCLTAAEKHAVKIMPPTEATLDSGEFDRFDDYE